MIRMFGRNLVNLDLYPGTSDDGKPVSNAGYINGRSTVVIQDVDGEKFHECKIAKQSAYCSQIYGFEGGIKRKVMDLVR